MRLDHYLHRNKLTNSREQAQNLIQQGKIKVNNQIIRKKSHQISPTDQITILPHKFQFLSRAGAKLQTALEYLQLNCENFNCLDIGCATGGFTDCLLQNNANHITAIDIGEGQLHPTLQNHPKITYLNQTDARNLPISIKNQNFHLIVADLSFISITKILEELSQISTFPIKPQFLLLLKPQYELTKSQHSTSTEFNKLKNPNFQNKILNTLKQNFKQHNFTLKKLFPSEITGKSGTQEFWAYLTK